MVLVMSWMEDEEKSCVLSFLMTQREEE